MVALIMTAATSSASYGLYFALVKSLPIGGDPSLIQFINSLFPVIGFIFNPVVFFVVFYKLSSKFDLQSNSAYVDLLKYVFVGGFLGYLAGFGAEEGLNYWSFGTGFALFGSSSIFNLVLQLISGGLSTAFIAFTAVVLWNFRSNHIFTAGADEQRSTPEPEGSSQPN